jgi:DNA polymerase elongation subunit (family B)
MLIAGYNISPETMEQNPVWKRGSISPDSILSRNRAEPVSEFLDPAEYLSEAKRCNLSIAANGVAFRKDKQGFLGELMEKMYAERKHFKGLMIQAQKRLVELDKSAPAEERQRIEYEISKYHNFQLVRKIQLNSAFGACGNEYFRYYDEEIAEAITVSGQLSIRWIEHYLNEFLNKSLKTKRVDFVIASDTDSVYLRLGELVKQVMPTETNKQKITKFLDKFCNDVIQPFINKKYAAAGISDVLIARKADQLEVELKTARPGVLVGRQGSGIEELRTGIQKTLGDAHRQVRINVVEVERVDADTVAQAARFPSSILADVAGRDEQAYAARVRFIDGDVQLIGSTPREELAPLVKEPTR